MLIYEEKIRYNPPIIKWISRSNLMLIVLTIILLFLLETGIVNWSIPLNLLYIMLFSSILIFTGCRQISYTLRMDMQGIQVTFLPVFGRRIQFQWGEILSMQVIPYRSAVEQKAYRGWLGNSNLPVLHVQLKNGGHFCFSIDKMLTRINTK